MLKRLSNANMETGSQIFCGMLGLFILTTPTHIATAKEVDAISIKRAPPDMPKHVFHSGHCKVEFDVSEDGKPINARTNFCTDNLFAENSIKTVEKWLYTPKTIDGVAVLSPGEQTSITYKLTDRNGELVPEAKIVDDKVSVFDDKKTKAKLTRQWPPYTGLPKKGEDSGFCCMVYSVSQLGFPFNVNAQSCSHEKFENPASTFIRYWSYEPVTINGKPVSSNGYQQVMHFAFRPRAKVQLPKNYTPLPGKPEDYERYCRAMS